jgi:hypothetical protein
MRFIPVAAFLAVALAGCGDGSGPSPPGPDTVYVSPRFTEAVSPDIIPQIYEYDWTIEGTTTDANGRWALAGGTVELRLQSPLYEAMAIQIVVPDTVSRDPDALRWYHPVVTVHRLVPALLRAEWTADFSGPTIRIEIYAPYGLAGVRLTSSSVYYQACLEGTPFPCDVMINGAVGGDPWGAPSAAGLQGWADLTGQWVGWPSDMPPDGYVGEVGTPGWSALVNVNIADDHGHIGHGSCGYALIPSDHRDLTCDALYTQ